MRGGREAIGRLKNNIVNTSTAGLGYAKNHASGVDGHTRGKVRGRILDRGGAKSIADHVHLVLPLTHWHGKAVWHAKIIRCLYSDDFWIRIRIVGWKSPAGTYRNFIIA